MACEFARTKLCLLALRWSQNSKTHTAVHTNRTLSWICRQTQFCLRIKTSRHIHLYIQTECCLGFAVSGNCPGKSFGYLILHGAFTHGSFGKKGGGGVGGGVGWGGGMCEMLEGGGRECWFVGLLGTVCDPSSQCEVSSHVRFEPQPK